MYALGIFLMQLFRDDYLFGEYDLSICFQRQQQITQIADELATESRAAYLLRSHDDDDSDADRDNDSDPGASCSCVEYRGLLSCSHHTHIRNDGVKHTHTHTHTHTQCDTHAH
jgi:hypothetical protein